MMGLLVNDREQREVEYLIKRELEELLMDLEDPRIDHTVKQSMVDRYHVLFRLFQRVANEQECSKYLLKKTYY